MTYRSEQPSLFSVAELRQCTYGTRPPAPPTLSAKELAAWKQRLWQFQRAVDIAPLAAQGSLFATEPDPDAIAAQLNPFDLPQQNIEFWRWQVSDAGEAALYFVLDTTASERPLLLYVGETVKSNQRWKGEHDCKRYVANYISAHRTHQLPVSVNIGFWRDAPTQTRPRQRLESALIRRWRSPFNKENWSFWHTPFIHGGSDS